MNSESQDDARKMEDSFLKSEERKQRQPLKVTRRRSSDKTTTGKRAIWIGPRLDIIEDMNNLNDFLNQKTSMHDLPEDSQNQEVLQPLSENPPFQINLEDVDGRKKRLISKVEIPNKPKNKWSGTLEHLHRFDSFENVRGSRNTISKTKLPSSKKFSSWETVKAPKARVDIFNFRRVTALQKNKIRRSCKVFLDSLGWGVFISLLTLIALFLDDVRILLFPASWDTYCDVVTLIVFAIFFIEMTASVIAYPTYCNSFYFWLDLLSTITMLFDLNSLDSLYDEPTAYEAYLNIAQIFRASRATKIGSKAGRMMRVLRLIRLARLAKLYKEKSKNEEKKLDIGEKKLMKDQYLKTGGKGAKARQKKIQRKNQKDLRKDSNLHKSLRIKQRICSAHDDLSMVQNSIIGMQSTLSKQNQQLKLNIDKIGNFMKNSLISGAKSRSKKNISIAGDASRYKKRFSKSQTTNLKLFEEMNHNFNTNNANRNKEDNGLKIRPKIKTENNINSRSNHNNSSFTAQDPNFFNKQSLIMLENQEDLKSNEKVGSNGKGGRGRIGESPNGKMSDFNEDENGEESSDEIVVPQSLISRAKKLKVDIDLSKRSKFNVVNLLMAKNRADITGETIESEMLKVNTVPKQSRVGKVLIQRNTKVLILVILVLLMIIPFLSAIVIFPPPVVCAQAVDHLLLYQSNEIPKERVKQIFSNIKDHFRKENIPVLYSRVPYIEQNSFPQIPDPSIRKSSLIICGKSKKSDQLIHHSSLILLVLDNNRETRFDALLRIMRTIVVMIILLVGSMCFSQDANELVLLPLENMMRLVNLIALKPNISKKLDYEVAGGDGHSLNNDEEEETLVIMKQIIKIGQLLVYVFGNAGNSIVADNIISPTEDFVLQISGERTVAIFAFCDIRQFTNMTEVLEEDIMVFVNEIAQIVHSVTDSMQGFANKNVGDAFLLVWTLPSKSLFIEESGSEEEDEKGQNEDNDDDKKLKKEDKNGKGKIKGKEILKGKKSEQGDKNKRKKKSKKKISSLDSESEIRRVSSIENQAKARDSSTKPHYRDGDGSNPPKNIRIQKMHLPSIKEVLESDREIKMRGGGSHHPQLSRQESFNSDSSSGTLPEKEASFHISENLRVLKTPQSTTLVEMAVTSVLQMTRELHRSDELYAYTQRKEVIAKMPDYKIKLGFGLHLGWAIEGAIGSIIKIDASYLSPHVNMSAKLEETTKEFGVPFLFTEEIFDLMSEETAQKCRMLDRVLFPGSQDPTELYTLDIKLKQIRQTKPNKVFKSFNTTGGFKNKLSKGNFKKLFTQYAGKSTKEIQREKKVDKQKKRFQTKYLLEKLFPHLKEPLTLLEIDPSLETMIRYPQDLITQFNHGIELYLQGNWSQSIQLLQPLLPSLVEDTPLLKVISFIEEYGQEGACPDWWPGFRPMGQVYFQLVIKR